MRSRLAATSLLLGLISLLLLLSTGACGKTSLQRPTTRGDTTTSPETSAGPDAYEWARLLSGDGPSHVQDVVYHDSGYLYLTGQTSTYPKGRDFDIFVAKFDRSGDRRWLRRFGSTEDDEPAGLAVDDEGHALVTGTTNGDIAEANNRGHEDVVVAKFDPKGTRQWVQLLGTDKADYGYGITVQNSGAVYFTGETRGNLGGDLDSGDAKLFVAKLHGSGDIDWIKLLEPSVNRSRAALAATDAGTIYVTGKFLGSFAGHDPSRYPDLFVVALDSSGRSEWLRVFGSEGDDTPYALELGSDGNIHIGGVSLGDIAGEPHNGGDGDGLVATFDSSGDRKWVELIGTPEDDWVLDIAVDATGNLYAGGSSRGSFGAKDRNPRLDGFTAEFTPSGRRGWPTTVTPSRSEQIFGTAVDDSGTLFVVGQTHGDIAGRDVEGREDGFLARVR